MVHCLHLIAMAFVLQQSATFSHPIVIREVTDGGRIRQHQFNAIYRRLPASRMEELQLAYHRIKSRAARDEEIDAIPTREIAAEILAGWSGITESNGTEIEYNENAKRDLLEVALVADVLVSTYWDAHEKARSKNS